MQNVIYILLIGSRKLESFFKVHHLEGFSCSSHVFWYFVHTLLAMHGGFLKNVGPYTVWKSSHRLLLR